MKHIKLFEQFIIEEKGTEILINNLSDIDFSRILKWLHLNINDDKYDLKRKKGKDFVLNISGALPSEISSIKNYLSSQSYINESVNESAVNENKKMYKISINTEVEDSKIGNKFYNVKKGEKVELIDDDGDIATVKLKSGEIVNIESEFVIESVNERNQGIFVRDTKGRHLYIDAEDLRKFNSGKIVYATDEDGEEYEVNKKFVEVMESEVNERNTKLYVYPLTKKDHQMISNWLDRSPFYAEEDSNSFMFPVSDQRDADATEKDLDGAFQKLGANARFVLEGRS